jgi:hypothetical protein
MVYGTESLSGEELHAVQLFVAMAAAGISGQYAMQPLRA